MQNSTSLKSYPDFVAILKDKKPLVLDIKPTIDASQGFAKDALFLVLNEKLKAVLNFAAINPETPVLIICEPEKIDEVLQTLASINFTNVLGVLEGGFDTWVKNKGEVNSFTNKDAPVIKNETNSIVLDVRTDDEWGNGVFPGSRLVSFKDLAKELQEGKLNDLKHKVVNVICKTGLRASAAASLLKSNGFGEVSVVKGGFDGMLEAGFESKKL